MTSAVIENGRRSPGADASPAWADAPTIQPHRRRLDRDSPNLAFTVSSRKRFVEVVLATDRGLFDPQNAARRDTHGFFASRAFGLTRTNGGDATYIVPTAVMRAFLEAQPRPREIFYTAIAYDDEQGSGPVLALPLAQLLASAPSVPLAVDFDVHGLTRSFGMALERLVRHADAWAAAPAAAPAAAHLTAEPAVPSQWRGSGTLHIPAAQGLDADDDATPAPAYDLSSIDADGFDRDEAPAARAADEDYDDGRGWDNGYGYDDQDAPAPVGDPDGDAAAAASSVDFDYDDGFGPDGRPVGVEPAELPDDDDEEVASAYGDEADEAPPARARVNGAAGPATPAPAPASTRGRPPLPTIDQLGGVLARVAATFDGHTLYAIARRSDAGLRFGIGAFDQRSGALGRLLARMKTVDPGAFARFFGDAGDALVAVTGAPTPEARLGAVAGRALVDDAWRDRFAAAGAHPPFVQAQNELVVATTLAPLWPVACGLGLTSDRALAVVIALGIQMGTEHAAEWLTARLAPAHTEQQVNAALAAIGAPDLASFQTQAGLASTGRIDADTKAAFALALRGLGAGSPLPVLTPSQMLESVRRHVGHGGVARKIVSLMDERSLGDQPR